MYEGFTLKGLNTVLRPAGYLLNHNKNQMLRYLIFLRFRLGGDRELMSLGEVGHL